MTSISARIDIIDAISEKETIQLVFNFLNHYSDKYLTSREEGKVTGKVHLHIYMLLREGITINTVRQFWKRHFDKWSGRKQERALALTKDIPKYLSYITKDGDLLWAKDIDLDSIEPWKNPKEYGNNILEKLRKYADENNEELQTREDCHKLVFRYAIHTQKIWNKYRKFDYAEALYERLDPEDSLQDYITWALER